MDDVGILVEQERERELVLALVRLWVAFFFCQDFRQGLWDSPVLKVVQGNKRVVALRKRARDTSLNDTYKAQSYEVVVNPITSSRARIKSQHSNQQKKDVSY